MPKKRRLKTLARQDFLKVALVSASRLLLTSCKRDASKPPTPTVIFPTVSVSTQTTPTGTLAQPPGPDRPICLDTSRSIEERVDDLLRQMSITEKVSQMSSESPAIERLEIPRYNWWSEALHGVASAGLATVFPQAIGLAGTWSPDLIYRMAVVISDEGCAKHHKVAREGKQGVYTGLTFFGQNINIFRDPRWGRGQETEVQLYLKDVDASLPVPLLELKGSQPENVLEGEFRVQE